MDGVESIARLYVLSIKGGYYTPDGQITEALSDARFFATERESINFREHHDPKHRVDCAMLLKLTIFVSEE